MCINSFNILDDEMNSIGTGIYLAASVMDHNCRPNALATFDGTTIQIRLLEDYTNKDGEVDISKIFISYIDLMDPTDVRRRQLSSQYYFDCNCQRCKDVDELNLMNAGACPNVNCDEPITMEGSGKLTEKCPSCETAIPRCARDKFREISSLTMSQLADMKDIACK